VTIHEPYTLLTDLLLALLAGWLAWRLRQDRRDDWGAARWWGRALALTAASALVGGTYHGFAPNFPDDLAHLWWIATLLIINLLSAVMAMGLLREIQPARGMGPWAGVIAGKFACFAVLAILVHKFIVVIVDYGLTMVAWAVAAAWLRRAWSSWMLAAIGLSVGAALIQQLHLAPSVRFNHNDLYHVIQAFALVCFYAAGKRLSRAAPASPPKDS
jgi:hypothetical protein